MEASRTTTSSRDEPSVSNASDMEAEWVEQDEPGVYITIRQLADGTRELRRVRFRSSFIHTFIHACMHFMSKLKVMYVLPFLFHVNDPGTYFFDEDHDPMLSVIYMSLKRE